MDAHLSRFLLALTFLTRLPVGSTLGAYIRKDERLGESFPWFPAVGLIIGTICGLVYFLTASALPALTAGLLAISTGIVLTGALHEDGLADCADALGNYGERSRLLEIMRDSRIGTYGALALIVSVGIRASLIALFPPIEGLMALVTAHVISRATMPLGPALAPYARDEGLGKLAESNSGFLIPFAIAFVCAFILYGGRGLVAWASAFLVSWAFVIYLKKRIGGYTGDGLGAMEQLSQIAVLIALALLSSDPPFPVDTL